MPHPTPPEQPIQTLLAQTAAGDPRAFRTLYDATSPRLFGAALALLRRRDLAEDAVQDAYLRIWTRAATYDPARGAPLPWMLRTLRNAAIDRLRSPAPATTDIMDLDTELLAPPAPIDDRLDIVRAMALLAEGPRQAILLTYLHGYTTEEAATRLHAPVGTVRSWMRRGAERLVRHFQSAHAPVPSPQTQPAQNRAERVLEPCD